MNILKICLICNKEYSDLKGHFKRMHNISNAEYKIRFPEYANMIEKEKKRKMSEAIQRRIADGSHPFVQEANKERAKNLALKFHSNKTEEYYKEQQRRAEIARRAKGNNYVHSEETKQKMRGPRPNLQGRKLSEETKLKLSEIAKNRKRKKHAPETILKMKNKWVERKKDPNYEAYINTLRENAIKNKLGEKYIENIISGKACQKFYDTGIELKFAKFLEDHNIEYIKQFVLENDSGKWLFDFYLPELNMLIEIDGEYWHSKSLEIVNRDRKKGNEAIKENYFFLRLSDNNWIPEIIFSPENFSIHNKVIIENRINKLK